MKKLWYFALCLLLVTALMLSFAACESKDSTETTAAPTEPTEPTEPFCNKSAHNVWLVLLIISAVVNVAFIVLTVVYFVRKKNNHKDTTPLVNYSIEEDNK